jgi:hypothetical protein
MITLILLFALAGLWAFTGRDPLWWAIHELIWTRAAIRLAYLHILDGWRRYKLELPGAVRDMRMQLSEEA